MKLSSNRQPSFGWHWIPAAMVVCGSLVNAGPIHAQEIYTSTPGKTSIYANYDPNAPAAKAPAAPEPAVSKQVLTTIPMGQYRALQAEIAKYSQASFSSPPAVEVTAGAGPLSRAPEAKAPIAAAPTSSWEGLSFTGLNPPSPDIAAGPSDVLMVVNSTIGQFTKAGVLKKSTTFQTWFANVLPTTCPSNCLLFDPWIAYDQMHGHFLFLAAAKSASTQTGTTYLLLSVSNGPTYDSGWKTWAMNISMDGNVATTNFGDFWHLGFDNVAVYLSGNMYSSSSPFGFLYAKVRVLKKTDLYNPALTSLPFQEIGSASKLLKNADGTIADSLIPVHMRGQPGNRAAAFFVNAANMSALPATYLTVWSITDPLAATLAMTATNIGGLMSYTTPAPAPQLASSVPINAGDTTVLKAIYRNGFLYTARNSGYRDATTSITYDVIDMSALRATTQARVVNSNAFYPSFDVPATTPLGAQTVTETDTPLSGTTTGADGLTTYPGLSRGLKAGETPFFSISACPVSPPTPCRWGDYFGGAIDPLTGGLWVSGEYAKSPLTGGAGIWGTWAAHFPWSTTQLFTDVPPSSVFFDYINVLNTWQITTGCSTTPAKFCPTDLVTREQLTTLIIRSMLGDSFPYQTTPYFTDVTDASPFFKYIQKAVELGISHGCTATTFCPAGSVPRMDASVLLVRGKLVSLFGDNFSYPTTPFFTDVPATMPQFPYVQKLYELGLTTGCTPTQFCPNNNLTRQEISVFLTRAFLN